MGINSEQTPIYSELHIKLTPKAAMNKVVAEGCDNASNGLFKIYVTAVPEDGKANAAMIKLLADYFGLPKSAFTITRGHTARKKVIRVAASFIDPAY